MSDENNMALNVFIEAAEKKDIGLSKDKLIQIYKIEERNQYKDSSERVNINKEIEKLILSSIKERKKWF